MPACAWPPRLRQRALAGLRYRRLRLCWRALHQHARLRRHRREAHQCPPRLGRRRRRGIRFRAALERQARISLQPSSIAPTFASPRRGAQFRPRLPAGPYRPQPQGRLAGIEQPHSEDRPDRPEIRSLGNPWPDHVSWTGLPAFRAPYTGTNSLRPRARRRPPGANSLYLSAQALGRRRGLLQPRTAAGLRFERHRRRCWIPAARRRSRTSPTRTTTPRGCLCDRPSDLAASRKSLPADGSSLRARSTSQADAAGRQVLGGRCL